MRKAGDRLGVSIKDSKKGTLKAAATKAGMSTEKFADHVMANKDEYSSKMIRKANFARNASKWKKS